MDFGTVIGIGTGLVMIVLAIVTKSGLEIFVSGPSFLIVAGGTLAALSVAYPLNETLSVFHILKRAFRRIRQDYEGEIQKLVALNKAYRTKGPLSLQDEISRTHDDFKRKGLQLIVDQTQVEVMVKILKTDIINMKELHAVGEEIFLEMGKYAPAFGMVGTLIGLIQMLANLGQPETIGPRMAIALVTTFYGAILANLIFIPIAVKLRRRSDQETIYRELLLEGFVSICQGDTPPIMQDKLQSYLLRLSGVREAS